MSAKAKIIFGHLNPLCKTPLSDITIRLATVSDIPAMEELASAELFDIGEHNLLLYFKHDLFVFTYYTCIISPNTFEVAVNEKNEIVAYNSYNRLPNIAVLMAHQIVVRSDYKGRGLTRMFNGMAYFPTSSELSHMGNATNDSIKRYPSMFNILGWKIVRYSAIYKGGVEYLDKKPLPGIQIQDLMKNDLSNLFAYDLNIVKIDRSPFIQEWCLPDVTSHGKTLIAVGKNKIVGYGTLRNCVRYDEVSPLYADNPEIAHRLLVSLLKLMNTGRLLYIPAPASNTTIATLAHQLHMKIEETDTRTYHVEAYRQVGRHLDLTKVYAFQEYWPV